MKRFLKHTLTVLLGTALIFTSMAGCTPVTTLPSTITQTPSGVAPSAPVIKPGAPPVITPSTATVPPPVVTPGTAPVTTPGNITSNIPGAITYQAPPPPPPPPADTTVPLVSITIPANLATGVAINGAISVAFGEALNPTTVNSNTFTVMQGTTPVSGIVTYTGLTATFTPNVAFATNTTYTATISTGVKDVAGNALASPFTWTWTTGTNLDFTAPLVSFTSPVNGATGVPINAKIGAFFTKALDPTTVTSDTFTLMRGTTNVAGIVTYIGVAATFTPNAPLATNTTYTATISTGVRDLAGNALASPFTWQWTTGLTPDITPPTVTSTINANGATGVSINSKVGAFFSEALDPLTVTTSTFTLMRGTTPVSGIVTYIGVAATFTPNVALATNTTYTATISTGVKDLAGNAMASPYIWTWTTGGAPDTTAPNVTSTIPLNGASGVTVNYPLISATFSKAIDPLTVTAATFTVNQGNTSVPGVVTVTYGNTANFLLAGALAYNTIYTATITTGAKDLAGNAMAVNKVWTFTTGGLATGGGGPPPSLLPVDLGTAANFAIFATTITDSVGQTVNVTGDMGVNVTAISGFGSLPLSPDGTYSTSAQVTGKIYKSTYALGTPAKVALAESDMVKAYNEAKARPAGVGPFSDAGVKTLDGLTLAPGIYTWDQYVLLSDSANVTLSGGPNDVWIFQIAQYFTTGHDSSVNLIGGAQAKNVFWATTQYVSTGANSHFEGVVLAKDYITLGALASANSRLLSQAAVTFGTTANVTQPTP